MEGPVHVYSFDVSYEMLSVQVFVYAHVYELLYVLTFQSKRETHVP
jgi:hypothetical protein